jgi:uncharacterized protein (TIGR03437 family)
VFFLADWSKVTDKPPARRGEILIVKMAGLGATFPDVPAGQPFPSEPLASVVCRIGATMNGVRTETLNAIGWPSAVDTYRVDIRVPAALKPGAAVLQLTARGVSAPAVRLPAR